MSLASAKPELSAAYLHSVSSQSPFGKKDNLKNNTLQVFIPRMRLVISPLFGPKMKKYRPHFFFIFYAGENKVSFFCDFKA